LLIPLIYVAYSLARGAIIHAYPYHFADPTLLGYPRALGNTALMLIGFWLLGLVVVAIDRRAGRLRDSQISQ